MASAQLELNVIYRNIPLYPHATLRDVDGSGGFLPSESPMPVGTLLTLSPVQNVTLQVPARVALVVEACRGAARPADELPGMSLTFEADGEQLLPYLQTGEQVAAAARAPVPEVVVTIPVIIQDPRPLPSDVPDKVILDEAQLAAPPPAAPPVEEPEAEQEAGDEGGGEEGEAKSGEADDDKKKKKGRRGGRRKKR